MKNKGNIRSVTTSKMFWPSVALLLIIIFNLAIQPNFLNIQIKDGQLFGSIIDILNRAAPLIIIAIGMTIIIATGGIDISVGSIIAISGAVAGFCIILGVPIYLTILLSIIAGILCGIWNGFLVSILGVQPMVATLILYIVGRGIAQLITKGQVLTFNNSTFNFIGGGYLFGLPFAIFIATFIILLIKILKDKTAFGLYIESIGVNKRACIYSGINVRRYVFLAYILSGVLAAVAGIIICSNIKSADANNAGLWLELDAILATVIGGTSMNGGRFNIGGTVIGALFIQSLTTTIYSLGVAPEVTLVVKSLVVIVVCLMQSQEFRKIIYSIKYKIIGGGKYENI